jgi:hypothetical protein
VSDLGSLNVRHSWNWLTSYNLDGDNLPLEKDGTKGLILAEDIIFWVVVKVPSNFVMTLH